MKKSETSALTLKELKAQFALWKEGEKSIFPFEYMSSVTLIVGPYGVGKTWLLSEIMNELPDPSLSLDTIISRVKGRWYLRPDDVEYLIESSNYSLFEGMSDNIASVFDDYETNLIMPYPNFKLWSEIIRSRVQNITGRGWVDEASVNYYSKLVKFSESNYHRFMKRFHENMTTWFDNIKPIIVQTDGALTGSPYQKNIGDASKLLPEEAFAKLKERWANPSEEDGSKTPNLVEDKSKIDKLLQNSGTSIPYSMQAALNAATNGKNDSSNTEASK